MKKINKRGAGRPLGSRDKRKDEFRAALRQYGKQVGVDPHYWMYDLLANAEARTDLKFQAAKELAAYLEPKLRTVEITGNPDKPLMTESPAERQARIEALLAKRDALTPAQIRLIDPG